MLIFIDESGIHKKDGHSTTSLVYVKVEHVEKLNSAILQLEKNLKIEPFHWSEEGWKGRQSFLEGIIKEDFEVKIFVFQNPFTEEKMEFALKHLIAEKYIKTIIIDGKKTRQYALRLKKALRERKVVVKHIRMGNDTSFPGLRLADLFAGLVRSYVDNRDNPKVIGLYKLAKTKITIQLMDGQVPASLFL